MAKFLLSFSIIFLGLTMGYLFKKLVERRIIRLGEARAESLRAFAQKYTLLLINPIIFCGAVWSLDLSDRRTFAFPLVGLFALVLGSVSGFLGSRILALPPERAGVYVTCSSFTNIGSIGGLILFLLVGETGFALLPFYKLFEDLWYYGVLFPLARHYGERANPGAGASTSSTPASGVLRVIRDPFFLVATAGIITGIGLNVAGFVRPAFYGKLNTYLVPASTFILLFTIGMRIRFKVERTHWRAAMFILTSKMVIVPVAALALAAALGLGSTGGGIGLQVVLVLSSMPIGFLGMVPPTLYRLDLAFANSLWLASNTALVFIVPALFLILRAWAI